MRARGSWYQAGWRRAQPCVSKDDRGSEGWKRVARRQRSPASSAVFDFSDLSDPIRGGLMRIGRNEIIEELTEHMRKFGGEPGEWYAGVAETNSKFQIPDSRETPSNISYLFC